MKLFFDNSDAIDDNFSNLKKIIAKGNVLFEREKETIKSDLVSFFLRKQNHNHRQCKSCKRKECWFTSDLLEIN